MAVCLGEAEASEFLMSNWKQVAHRLHFEEHWFREMDKKNPLYREFSSIMVISWMHRYREREREKPIQVYRYGKSFHL